MASRNRSSRSLTVQTEQIAQKQHEVTKTSTGKKKNKCVRRLLVVFLFLLILYPIPGLLIYFIPWFQQAIIYVHHVKTPFYGNLSDPASYGLKAAKQFELYHEDGCEVELWHILPSDYHDTEVHREEHYLKALSDDLPIILYLHGNTGTRAIYHRIKLYKYLAEERGYHVITFDYRGYANSECYPSERGMMEDAHLVWKWLRTNTRDSKIYIWGHSLGSAAATYLAKELCDCDTEPPGLILDAPLTNMIDAAENHPLGYGYWPIMPLFRYLVLENFEEKFESANRLKHITSPILILHGRDDVIIPFHIGEKMYRIGSEDKKKGEIEFVDCGESNHKNNYESHHAQSALNSFIKP